jgi:hypothetical protein
MLCRLRWPWRFTLRGLFIATTFLAIVLGMIAWLDQTRLENKKKAAGKIPRRLFVWNNSPLVFSRLP